MLPQFDFTTYSSQIFWLFLCFAVLFLFIKYYFLPAIQGVLDVRDTKISDDIKHTKSNLEHAEAMLKNQKDLILQAKERADHVIKDEVTKMRLVMESKVADITKKIDLDVKERVEKHHILEAKMIENIEENVVSCATQILSKLFKSESSKLDLDLLKKTVKDNMYV